MNKIAKLIIISMAFISSTCEKGERYPHYQLSSKDIIPDSNKQKAAEFIVKTVSAASLHMAAGDYEDPEDVIEQAEETASNLYSVKIKGLNMLVGGNSYWEFIPPDQFSPEQKIIFDKLNK